MVAQSLVNNQGARILIQEGATVIVRTNSIDNNQGEIHNGGTLIVEGTYENDDLSTGNGTTTGVYEVEGDWVNNGTFTADQSLVRLTGAGQFITGSSITTFHGLSLEGTGIKTQTIDAIVNDSLALNDRELATGQYRMTVSTGNPAAITRTTGFVSSEGIGQLARRMTQTVPYLFPLGSSVGTTRYRPLDMQPVSAGTHEFGARLANLDPSTDAFDRLVREEQICMVNDQYYHRIYRNTGNVNVDITSYYDPTEGDWETLAHWQNLPQWEKTTNGTAGVAAPFNTLTTLNWGNFNTEAFALATLHPVIDSTNLAVLDNYCSLNSGGVTGLQIVNDAVGTVYEWTDANGAVVGNGVDLSGVDAGTYTLTITKANGCGESATFTIGIIPAFEVAVTGTDVLCQGYSTGAASVTLTNGFPPFTYNWSHGPITQNVTDLAAGNYTVTVTDDRGCAVTETITINEPNVSFDYDIAGVEVLCHGGSTGAASLVNFEDGLPPYDFAWDHGPTTQDVTGLSAGNYSVTVTDANGCAHVENITISQPPDLVLTTTSTSEECEGINGTATVQPSGGVLPYAYSWHTVPVQSSAMASGLAAGTYTVTVTDGNNCTETTSESLNNIPTPTAAFSADAEVNVPMLLSNATVSFMNESVNATTYRWNFGDGATTQASNPTHLFEDTGDFYVILTAINSVGCSTQDTLGPFVVIPDGAIYVPNAFSPNFDGYNDVFKIGGEGLVSFQLVIFNRWGREVAELTDISQTWDGTYNDQLVPEGVYTFLLKAVTNSGAKLERGGTITVIR